MKEIKTCVVCKKNKIKWVTTNLYNLNYGFCSKICIANNAIRHFKLKKTEEVKTK